MPQLLELAQLVDQHGVPEVQIGGGWIETGLDAQGLPALELGDKLRLDQDLFRSTLDQRQLLFDRLHEAAHYDTKKGRSRYKITGHLQNATQKGRAAHREPACQGCLKDALVII